MAGNKENGNVFHKFSLKKDGKDLLRNAGVSG
jgi:hypothetical protein